MKRNYFLIAISVLLITSCVAPRVLEEEKTKRAACESELAALKKTNQQNEAKITDLQDQLNKVNKYNDGLKRDTAIIGNNLRNMNSK